jgi:hypothetical protein
VGRQLEQKDLKKTGNQHSQWDSTGENENCLDETINKIYKDNIIFQNHYLYIYIVGLSVRPKGAKIQMATEKSGQGPNMEEGIEIMTNPSSTNYEI